MTDGQLRVLLDLWRQRLGLAHWRIELKFGSCESEDSYFEIQRQPEYERAVIFYQPWLLSGMKPDSVIDLELTDESIETSLVHELMHCHTIGMVGVVREGYDGLIQPDAERALLQQFEREEERCVDRLAYALVSAWPRKLAFGHSQSGTDGESS